MGLAHVLSLRSTCKRLAVGCVITDEQLERVNAVGYNGGAKGFPHECRKDETGNCGDIHAEMNAHAKLSEKDVRKVYFITSNPCEICAKLIVNSGASKVYIAANSYRSNVGLKVLEQAGIPVMKAEPEHQLVNRTQEALIHMKSGTQKILEDR